MRVYTKLQTGDKIAILTLLALSIYVIYGNYEMRVRPSSYTEWAKQKTFPYSAPIERQNYLLTNAAKLRLGMTKEQVEAIMGKPDFHNSHIQPSSGGWHYILYKERASGETGNSKRIVLGFVEDKLAVIRGWNVEGFKDTEGQSLDKSAATFLERDKKILGYGAGAPQRQHGRLAASMEAGLGVVPRMDVLGEPVLAIG